MALSGSFYGTTANSKIKPKIQWYAEQSVTGNYSQITATLTYSRTNTGYTTEGYWTGSMTIGTDTAKASDVKVKITYQSNTVAITHTAKVAHDAYGKLNVTICATGDITNPSGSSLKDTTIRQTVTLNTIARASSISGTNADIESRSTIVISRKSDEFTHCVAFSFGDLSGYIDDQGNISATEVRLSATTINFLLPASFYEQISDAPSGVCALECRTYAGSTHIGTQTGEFIATAGRRLCAPVVKGNVVDCNPSTVALTGDSSKLVRFCSTAHCVISAQARNGARITRLKIGDVEVEESLDILHADCDSVTFQATDTRGYTELYPCPVTQIPYVQLGNEATVCRTDPTSGNGELRLEGPCWKGNFGAVENALTATIQVNEEQPRQLQLEIGDDHRYSATVALSGLDYTKAHTVKVAVSDQIMSAEALLPVQKGIPVFDWGESDFAFHVPVELPELTVGGVPLADYIKEVMKGQ